MKSRLIIVAILVASIILYSSPMMLTRVGAVSNYNVTITWTDYTQTHGSFTTTGLVFINVDGTNYTTPQTFSWPLGSTHNLTAYSYVYDGPHGYVYLFANWSDSGAVRHVYTVVGPDTVTANYNTYWAGDLNFDHSVDIYDAVILAASFGATPTSINWNKYADILHVGVIDIFDAIILASNFGKTGP